MNGRRPNLFVSAGAFIIGAILVYYVFSTHASGADFADTFRRLTPAWRALAVAGFIATAWGTGGLLNNLLRARDEAEPPSGDRCLLIRRKQKALKI